MIMVEFIYKILDFVTNRKADKILGVDGYKLYDVLADTKSSGRIGRIAWIAWFFLCGQTKIGPPLYYAV